MFALNLNKIPYAFYGKAALIDYLKSIKTQNSNWFRSHNGCITSDIFLNATVTSRKRHYCVVFCKSNQFNNPEDLSKYKNTARKNKD
jgi:pantoate--beta-alanine ligase